jgi:hypothetical protein
LSTILGGNYSLNILNSGDTTITPSSIAVNVVAWQLVGNSGFSAGHSSFTSLAFNPVTNEPYVAYSDDSNSGKATVMKFDGNSWVYVGTAGFSAGAASYTSLAFNGATPYVAYSDNSNSNKATVMKFDGNSWVYVGTAGFSAGAAAYTSLAFDTKAPSHNMYIAYQDGNAANKATVMFFNYTNNQWANFGTPGFSAGAVAYTSIAVKGNGSNTPDNVAVAYQDAANSDKATVMTYIYSSSNWASAGSPGFSKGTIHDISLAYDKYAQPAVAYWDEANGAKATFMHYIGGVWSGYPDGFSAGKAIYTSLAFNPSTNQPYVAYRDTTNANKATVMNLVGSSWNNVSNSGFSEGSVVYTSLAFNPSTNLPYVAFSDEANANKASVMKIVQ